MKTFKIIGLMILIVLSFYFTDKIMIFLENQNPLMQELKLKSAFYETNAIDATVIDNQIIPGLNGKKVNLRQSYFKMGEFGSFNETFLIFEQIKPKISVNDHLNKIIIAGNPVKRAVSLVLENGSKVSNYLSEQKIEYTMVAYLKSDLKLATEYLNGEKDENNASDLNAILNKNKVNSHLCLVGYANLEFCVKKKYLIVAPTLDTSLNVTSLLGKIKSGDIILVTSSTSIEALKLILKEIQRQDLKIISLSTLIDETI